MRTALILIAAFAFQSYTSNAAEVAKRAQPLTQSETFRLFANHTINIRHEGSNVRNFYDTNGKMMGIKSKGTKTFVYNGTWSVRGNRMCNTSTGKELASRKRFSVRDCIAMYRQGNRVTSYVVVEHSGEAALKDKKINIVFTRGNTVAKEHAMLK